LSEEAGTPNARELAALGLLRIGASAMLLGTGFRALSDDDYSRLVIAQRFAQSPAFDPSGTSWLPLPFWLYGAALRVFGPSVSVARATAVLLGLLTTFALFVAARFIGASRRGALLGAALGTLTSYSVLLGVTALPEAPCAALILLGMASLAGKDRARRLLGALAIAAACACRYEAWPVAAVIALVNAADALKGRRELLPAALAALGFPLLWMSYGALHHGNAFFFVTRVTAYRQALGLPVEPLWRRAAAIPLELAALPGTVTALLFLGIVSGRVTRRLPRPPLWAAAALFAFLIAGSLSDGVPTHHPERVLLPLSFLLAVLTGDHVVQLWARGRKAVGWLIAVVLAGTCLLSLRRDYRTALACALSDRRDELEIGRLAREEGVKHLLIDSQDYAFFAVIAAFGDPAHAVPIDDHDPRKQRAPDPFADSASFDALLRNGRSRELVLSSEHVALARGRCRERGTRGRYTLVSCQPP
jgi:hypothetical protein